MTSEVMTYHFCLELKCEAIINFFFLFLYEQMKEGFENVRVNINIIKSRSTRIIKNQNSCSNFMKSTINRPSHTIIEYHCLCGAFK